MGYARTSLKGVMYYDSRRAFNGFTLFTPAEGRGSWLIDMMGRGVNHWETNYFPGQDARLLPNGNLLYAGKLDNGPVADLEGAGGILMEIDWDGNLVWKYEDPYLHHSFDRLENGNTLVLKWVKVPKDIARKIKGGDPGSEKNGSMWGDAILEIGPSGDKIWEWIAHEHLEPDKMPRCPACPRDSWTHATSVSQFPDGNLVLSMAKSNTVAIINRNTGSVTWQWGEGALAHQHCASILDNGNILIFNNGFHPYGFAWGYSKIMEINPKSNKVVWTYGGGEDTTEFYSATMASCQRLPNGNTLICEGTTGRIFEVDPHLKMVWEFSNNLPLYAPYPAQTRSHMVCSAYRYGHDYAGLKEAASSSVKRQAAPGTAEGTEEEISMTLESRIKGLGY